MSPITLVLLPGLDGSGTLFANLLPELPKEIKVIAAAYPQHQFLSYSQLVLWLKDVVPRDCAYVVLGESFGSELAVKFAATHPPNLAGIILCAGFVSNPVRSWGILPRLLANPFLFQFQPPDFAVKYFVAGPHAPKILLQAVRAARRSVSAAVFAKRAQATIHCDAREEIRNVNVPLLYLQATEDHLVEKSSLAEIRRLHPQTISVSIRAPHLLLQTEPRASAEVITDFLVAQGLFEA
ncbi:MAG TPA: alpha/beta hydrolase [Candidatus Saccharimonadales bacterium]|nr:alpha/beta hydrolase [Candidatus Saccharimonadales bacterium]